MNQSPSLWVCKPRVARCFPLQPTRLPAYQAKLVERGHQTGCQSQLSGKHRDGVALIGRGAPRSARRQKEAIAAVIGGRTARKDRSVVTSDRAPAFFSVTANALNSREAAIADASSRDTTAKTVKGTGSGVGTSAKGQAVTAVIVGGAAVAVRDANAPLGTAKVIGGAEASGELAIGSPT